MKILYISSAPSKKQFDYMQTNIKRDLYGKCISGMPESSFQFHNSIINGLISNNCDIYSVVGRPISNKTYSKLFWPIALEKKTNIIYNHLFIINIPIIKHLCCFFQLLFILFYWLMKNISDNEKSIIIDASYVSLIPVVNFVTRFFSCKKIAIVADVYNYMASIDNNVKASFKTRIIRKIIKYEYQQINGFVFLTEKMKELEPFKNKPYIVMEGIYDKLVVDDKTNADFNYIMYAGAIKKEFGIERLIKAFMSYKNFKIKLLIFGNGIYVEEMKKIIKRDERIVYMGSVSLSDVKKYEKNALLLINPRPTNDEFTKYSFPSKIIEYMSSGTPVLTSKLSGIPKEYDDYLYYLDDDSVAELVKKIKFLLSKPQKKLKEFGTKAREFIIGNKNSHIQTKKIVSFIGKLEIKNKNPKEKLLLAYMLFNVLIIFLSICNPFGLYPVSFTTYLLYICSVIFTIMGIQYQFKNKTKNKSPCSDDNIAVNNVNKINSFFNSNAFILILFIELFFLLMYCGKYFYLVLTSADTNYRMIAFTNLFSNAFSALFYNYIVSNIGKFFIILLPVLTFDKELQINRKKLITLLCFIVFVIISLIGLARVYFLLLIFSTLLVLLYYNGIKYLFNKRKLIKLFSFFIVLFTVSCIMLGFRLFSNNAFSIEIVFSTIWHQIKQIFDYFLGSFRLLDFFLKKGFDGISPLFLGRATLAGVDEISIYALKIVTDDIMSFNQIIGPITQTEHAIGTSTPFYNAFYTSLLNFYLDFKIAGVVLFSFFHGVFINCIFKIYDKKINIISKVLVIYVSYNLFMTVLKWEYQSGSNVFMIIVLLLILFYKEIIDFMAKLFKKEGGKK